MSHELNHMNLNIYCKGTHKLNSALIWDSCRSSVNRTRISLWCLVPTGRIREKPDPLVSKALLSICFVCSVLYDKLHTLSRQEQGEPGQILTEQVKKFILKVCHLDISRCMYIQQCVYLLTICCSFDFCY